MTGSLTFHHCLGLLCDEEKAIDVGPQHGLIFMLRISRELARCKNPGMLIRVSIRQDFGPFRNCAVASCRLADGENVRIVARSNRGTYGDHFVVQAMKGRHKAGSYPARGSGDDRDFSVLCSCRTSFPHLAARCVSRFRE
jgi:hypothetical protein